MKEKETNKMLPLAKENYKILIIGIVLMVLGYLLMGGGKPEDPNEFNPEVFSFTRITLAPILILAGIAVEFYGIVKKPKDN